MKTFIHITLLLIIVGCSNGNGQHREEKERQVGGNCEGCEAIHESPLAFDLLNETDTLPGFGEGGENIMIAGRVFRKDGSSPAANVVLYVYHTDSSGVYPTKGDEKGWARQHGYLRGWVRTNARGEYRLYTTRPGSYPNSTNPQHIHIIVKEPGVKEYWIDDYHFSDDPLVTAGIREPSGKRAGTGLVQLRREGNILVANRDIILGLNIPGY